jgi:hypothetical protein
MARGKKSLDPLHQSDIDLLGFAPLLDALSRADTAIEGGSSVLQLTAIQFARIAEVAVEQHSKDLRQGTVSEFRKRARNLIESALAEACYLSGRRDELHRLVGEGILSCQRFYELLNELAPKEIDIWRKAAAHAALILRDIQHHVERKKKKGRPRGAHTADALAALVDADILRTAQAKTKKRHPTRDEITQEIPSTVQEFLRLGQLPALGATVPEAIERHSKRLRHHLDELAANPPIGGSSIIRKVT